MADPRNGYPSSDRKVTDLRNPPTGPALGIRLHSDETCAIQDSSGAPGRLNRGHFEAVERVIADRLAAVVAVCDVADSEARHVVDDEVYVSVGLIRNALNGLDQRDIPPGKPAATEPTA